MSRQYINVFKYRCRKKGPARVIAIMDNSKKTWKRTQDADWMNDSIKRHKFVHLFSSFFLHLILKIIDLFSFSFVLVVPIFILINQSVEKRERERQRKKIDDHSREIEHLSVKGHCPVETWLDKYVSQTNEQSGN